MQHQPVSPVFSLSCAAILLCLLAAPCLAITLTPGSAGSSTAVISNGDPVTVTGVATGHPQQGLQVWLVGYNTVRIGTVSVGADNTYTYELKAADTQNLASGQYLVIVQHPMMNGQFDIVYDSSTGRVVNKQLGSGTSIFQLTSGGSLQSTDASSALMRAIASQNIDDTFATASFTINPPDAMIHPIGDHVVGDRFTITGSTNLAVGDNLQVDVYSSSFAPTKKSQSGEYSGASGVVQVQPGTGKNSWSFAIDSSTFRPDEYIVTVKGITQDVSASSTFLLRQSAPATTVTAASTESAPATPVPPASVPAPAGTVPAPTKAALPAGGAVVALLVSLVLLCRHNRGA